MNANDKRAVLLSRITAALDDAAFRTNRDMRNRVAIRISNTYRDTGVVPPKLDTVIGDALAEVSADLRERARELTECQKVDDCGPKAAVFALLADFLDAPAESEAS